jgi:hypothetical protein
MSLVIMSSAAFQKQQFEGVIVVTFTDGWVFGFNAPPCYLAVRATGGRLFLHQPWIHFHGRRD